VNKPVSTARRDAVLPRRSAMVGRRAVLQGLGVFLLAGCASGPAKKSTAKSTSLRGPIGVSAPATPSSAQDSPRPKTVQEFVKQQPTRLPFDDKE